MPEMPVDFSNRYTIAYSLLALTIITSTALGVRYLRWRRAEHRRRYGIGRRSDHRR